MPKIRDLGVKVIPETMRPPEIGPGTVCDCSNPVTFICGCSNPITVGCGCSDPVTCGFVTCACSNPITIICGCSDPVTCGPCTAFTCFCSRQDTIIGVCNQQSLPPWSVDRAQLEALKQELRNRLEEIEKVEASLGPQTADAIEAREKEIKAELDELKARRKDLDKKK